MRTTQKRRWRYGTASYGYKAALRWMRAYATSQREYALDQDRFSGSERRNICAHSAAVAAVSGLYEAGALNQRQHDRFFARIRRITYAKVTRRPFVLKAAA